MNLRNLLLVGLLLFALGSTGYSQFFADGSTIDQLIRDGLMALLGVGGLVYSNFGNIAGLFSRKSRAGQIYTPEDFEAEDFKCLVHIRNRVEAAGDQVGLDICNKLNGILFDLNRRNKKEKDSV